MVGEAEPAWLVVPQKGSLPDAHLTGNSAAQAGPEDTRLYF